ncbi:MAG: NAD-dependent epimerase/dehydratase family protein [Planctomycetes bacterium]|nr:NAD-dependent epimerase/dehydratase family protein [Planctomycetota bacterium]
MSHSVGLERVLVTGANGFIGAALGRRLVHEGVRVAGVVRRSEAARELPRGVEPILVGDFRDSAALDGALMRAGFRSFDAVVHLAARVHQMRETASDPLASYRETNTLATRRLARWAAHRGARRFVFVSSVKVHGEGTAWGESPRTYVESDLPEPRDPYGISKWEAEQELERVAASTALQTVVLRPTLVYGPGVRANFLELLRLVRSGWPLPLGGVSNARSLVHIENLVDAIRASLGHPRAVGETFLVSDDEHLSTPELIRHMASGMGIQPRLISCPPALLVWVGRCTGRSAAVSRILGSLRVSNQKIRDRLDWRPPFSAHQGLEATANWYATVGRAGLNAPSDRRAA